MENYTIVNPKVSDLEFINEDNGNSSELYDEDIHETPF